MFAQRGGPMHRSARSASVKRELRNDRPDRDYSRTIHTSAGPSAVSCTCGGWYRS